LLPYWASRGAVSDAEEDLEEEVEEHHQTHCGVDGVLVGVVDDVRATGSGAADLVKDICRLKPEKLIYISCDPGTLARDCGLFSTGGYQVQASVPVDMFPQTYHIESVTLLQQVTEDL
jgi:tRNA/tmRNA/rRNA uracil-C5-methylase (TrmA/RlmC/RlmD family)